MTHHSMELSKKLESLRLAYAEQLPNKLKNINDCWKDLEKGNKQKIEELHFLIHGISGSGKIFGFEKLGDCAKDIEETLKKWMKTHRKLDTNFKQDLQDKVQNLHDAAKTQLDQFSERSKSNGEAHPIERIEEQLIYIIDENEEAIDDLQSKLKSFGFKVRSYHSIQSFSEDTSQVTPAALILDMSLIDRSNDHLPLSINIPIGGRADYPVIFVSENSHFTTRLNAVRYGSEGFFVKPIDITRLIDRLNNAIKDYNEEPYRVLIVDDDKFLANYYSLTLQKHGMIVSITSDPNDVIAALKHSKPELILMDIYMPTCSGIELAKVIRQEDDFLNIPIVFLSTETNIDRQYLAMRMGGDDFLTKPIEDEHLISAVSIRTRHARALTALMGQDSLTGLLKHTKIKERLASEISRAQCSGSSLAFAMIDIDNFKLINDRYGHTMGDQVIKSTSQILKQRLRQSNNIGRYGGEEFAVILPDCNKESALRILEKIREQFNSISFSAHKVQFTASLSIGIATFPAYNDLDTLLEATDKALYEAKNTGRNTVVVTD